jgi:hypothetical protein
MSDRDIRYVTASNYKVWPDERDGSRFVVLGLDFSERERIFLRDIGETRDGIGLPLTKDDAIHLAAKLLSTALSLT